MLFVRFCKFCVSCTKVSVHQKAGVALNPGLSSMRDVASANISYDGTQSNRICCFPYFKRISVKRNLLFSVFPKDLNQTESVVFRISKGSQSNRICCFPYFQRIPVQIIYDLLFTDIGTSYLLYSYIIR